MTSGQRTKIIDAGALDAVMHEVFETPGAELYALEAAAFEGGQSFYHYGRSRDAGLSSPRLYRVASISKMAVAMCALAMAERGLFDIDEDLSRYLGWPLRNPSYPDAPISAALVLSHRSSLRDGPGYSLPLGCALREFFEPGGRGYHDGLHFARPKPGQASRAPGDYFSYCNLGYGVLATTLEKAAGERFDRLIKRLILEPLGTEASFNVNLLSNDAFARLSPIFRTGAEGDYTPGASWVPQVDAYGGARPALPCQALPSLGPEALDAYVPGTNGTLFSPQGGMRATIEDVAAIGLCLAGGGLAPNGRRVLSRESVAAMTSERWRYDPAARNGDNYGGLIRVSGLGLMKGAAAFDAEGGDRLLPEGGPKLWGHHADAYGLLGGCMFDPDSGKGFAHIIGGTAEDPEKLRGRHSSFYLWEERIQGALVRALGY